MEQETDTEPLIDFQTRPVRSQKPVKRHKEPPKQKRRYKGKILALVAILMAVIYLVSWFYDVYRVRLQIPLKSPIIIEHRVTKAQPSSVVPVAIIKEVHAEENKGANTVVATEAATKAPESIAKGDGASGSDDNGGKVGAQQSNYAEFEKQAAHYKLTEAQKSLLKRIGQAESGFRMVPTNIEGSSAYGIFQLLKVHDKRAAKLGVSRKTLSGNITLAIIIFKEQGTTPWLASKHRANGTGWGD